MITHYRNKEQYSILLIIRPDYRLFGHRIPFETQGASFETCTRLSAKPSNCLDESE